MAPTKTKTTKKKPKKDPVKVVQKITDDLVKHLGIEVKNEVKLGDQGEVLVQFESEDPGILIGYHGENLASIQLMLTMMAYHQIGEWTRVLVNVGDYRERRQKSLERMALSAAQKVKFSGESQALPPMPPPERRIVHLALANEEQVVTESEGDDRYRRVVIKPK
jgi:spoIIIJ-associated protein